MYQYKRNNKIDIDEINLKEFFKLVFRYKWIIFLITAVSVLIASVIAYYISNIYEAKATVEISVDNNSKILSGDTIQEALKGYYISNADIDTEIAIIKSRFIMMDAIESVNLTKHIWGVNRFYKRVELYKNSPIDFNITYSKEFKYIVIPMDDKKFQFIAIKDDTNRDFSYIFKKKCKWGEHIKTQYFDMYINKKSNKPFKYKKFILKVYNPYYVAKYIQDKRLSVKQIGKEAKILEISYKDVSPLRAKEFVNALAKNYMKQNIKLKTKVANQTLNFINSQLLLIQKNLKKSENRLQNFKIKNKTLDIAESSRKISDTLSEYESKLRALNMKLEIMQNLYKSIKYNKNLESLTLGGVDIENSNLSILVTELQKSLIKRKALLKDYTLEHPEVKKLSTKIISIKSIIRKSLGNILNNLKKSKALIQKNISIFQNKLKTLPTLQQNYLKLERSFAFNEKFYSYLLEKRTETQIKKAATVNRNRIIDLAYPPIKPVKAQKKLIIFIGLIGGFFIGMLIVFIKVYLDDRIKNEDYIINKTDIYIKGVIPSFKKSNRDFAIFDKKNSMVKEAFRALRTNILHNFQKSEKGKIIVITSNIRGEGKSFVAKNLGAIFAIANKETVILDFDLRLKHKIYKEFNDKGMHEYLTDRLALSEAIKTTNLDNLDIIYSGNITEKSTELILSSKVDEMFKYLKDIYDFIIVDTPPVGIFSDARILIKYADTTLYILRANYSKKEFIKKINNLKLYDRIKNLFIVLNDVEEFKYNDIKKR